MKININPLNHDFLYIGDATDNSVKRFKLNGHFDDIFVKPDDDVLIGPRGLIFNTEGNLLISNQNVELLINGNVLKYDVQNKVISQLVSSTEEGAPFAPRGIILYNNVLFVADVVASNSEPPEPGDIRAYNGTTGDFITTLDHSDYCGEFYPRSLVIGPDSLLYVSIRNANQLGGSILRFDPVTMEFIDVFVHSNTINDLHRPEGLVFGPDGNLYITSFRKDTNDTDKILIFNGFTGCFLGKIDFYKVGQPRVFAQAILFGPDKKLYVPITGGAEDASDIGSVRRYDVHRKKFDIFIPADGTLESPWYLTFGNTNPATLAYNSPRIG